MKRLTILALTLLILATGCGETSYHLTINRDGSGDIDLRVVLSSLALELLGQVNSDPLSTLTGTLEQEGFVVTPVQEKGITGVSAHKHIAELTYLEMGRTPGATALAATPGEVQIRRGLFKTRYSFATDVDPLNLPRFRELGSVENYLLSQMDYKFSLTLPMAPDTHNAMSTADAGKTLIWQLNPGQENRVQVEVSHWNPAGFAFIALLLTLGAGIYWYFRKTKEAPQD